MNYLREGLLRDEDDGMKPPAMGGDIVSRGSRDQILERMEEIITLRKLKEIRYLVRSFSQVC